MKFFKSVTNLVFSAVVLLLVAALVCTSVIIVKKNNKINEINALIAQNEIEIGEIGDREAQLEAELAQSKKSEADTQAKLAAAEQEKAKLSEEKKKLQNENNELKKRIEKLSAEKKAQAEAALNAASGQSPVTPGSKVCYLTFDDGPSDNTLYILDILARYNAKATFFVIKTSKFEYVKKIHEAGHTIGLHSNSHVYSQIYSSTDAYFADLKAISDAVEAQTGVKSNIIRFPGGGSNGVSKKYCVGIMTKLTKMVGEKGYFYFDWNVSSGDAESTRPAASKIVNNVLTQARNKDSICVLMHDAAAKTTTVEALPAIIEGLAAQGFRFEGLTSQSKGYHHGVNN